LTGSTIGKHKIKSLESISPNKTIEGFIGGVCGAVILNLIYVNYVNLDKNILLVIIFTIIAAFLSETGDLVASFIKRKCKIKDYGNLIPGHGGILDRFDSILFISPCLYLFTLI
ncbi:MAG: CDP-archaeol synthase, partial [Anaerococcus vaginalis]|nr:CDP-archaeol synthase [Anaerococcus vaginalis]